MKRWKFVHVRRSGPFANYPKSIFSWDNVACILEKEMRQIYPWLKQVGRRVYEPILFPPTTSAFGVWTKAIAEECARNGGWATLHSEKIRLNRYNRRRVRQALRCNPFAEVPQNIRINKRDIMQRRLLYNLHQCLLALLERPQCSYCEHRNWTERGVIGHMTVTHSDKLEDENERFFLEIERDL